MDVLQKMVGASLDELKEMTSSGNYNKVQPPCLYNGGNGNIFFDCDWEAENNSSAGPCGGMAHFWELVTYWYKLTDERGFYDAVEKDLGFEREWIRLGHTHDTTCDSSVCLNATGTNLGLQGQHHGSAAHHGVQLRCHDHNMVQGAQTDSRNDSILDNMKEVKKIGQRAIEEDKKNLIFKILNIILLVVPFVGEVTGLAGTVGAQIARASYSCWWMLPMLV
ncbi:hypothetical protein NQ176_g4682 [Zarea fungicola]|uniref:Uncharacterized protein n=1 Tax=Zarea fungicola TaxID=93591 RepID=A0ACC1NC51_9HYPO|nr:hypothetical protein NQ176_g4682 [Lecanicillium fungicola]